MFSSKGTSTISSPRSRGIWRRLSRLVGSAELRWPEWDSSTLPGNSQGWTTVKLAGWQMEASGIPSPGREQTAAPLSPGCAASASHLPITSMESTATRQAMNKCRTLLSVPPSLRDEKMTKTPSKIVKKKNYFSPVLFSSGVSFYIFMPPQVI